jgi:hypothetical protein
MYSSNTSPSNTLPVSEYYFPGKTFRKCSKGLQPPALAQVPAHFYDGDVEMGNFAVFIADCL